MEHGTCADGLIPVKRSLKFVPTIVVTLLMYAHAAKPAKWSKAAKVLSTDAADIACSPRQSSFYAPDLGTTLTVLCHWNSSVSVYSVQVKIANGRTFEAPSDEGAKELLWSPDSRSFFVNGGTSSHAGFFVAVYLLDRDHGLRKIDVTSLAQRDMVASFPPCEAWNRNGDDECKQIVANSRYNMSVIRWSSDSSAIDIFAEIPCSNSYGGIMCQVKGYRVNATTGQIIKSYPARSIPAVWKEAMGWQMRVPEAPRYGAANITFK